MLKCTGRASLRVHAMVDIWVLAGDGSTVRRHHLCHRVCLHARDNASFYNIHHFECKIHHKNMPVQAYAQTSIENAEMM